VKSSKNKTFQEIVKNHENTFRILGVDVEDCVAKRHARKAKTTEPTTSDKKIKTNNSNNSCSLNQYVNTSTPTTLNDIFLEKTCTVQTPNKSFAINSQTKINHTDLDVTVVLGHSNIKKQDIDIKKDFIITDYSTKELIKQIENLKSLLQKERNRADEGCKRAEELENECKAKKELEEMQRKEKEENRFIKQKQMMDEIDALKKENEELKNKLKEKENSFDRITYF